MDINEMKNKKENYWQCRFCMKKIDKFEGYEKFANISEYTPSIMCGLYKAKDKWKDNEFYNHLETWDGAKRMYCKYAYDKETGTTFKHRTEYYRHKKKHDFTPKMKDEPDKDKKQLVKKICRRLQELYNAGHRPNDIEWSIEPKSESDSEEENVKMEIIDY